MERLKPLNDVVFKFMFGQNHDKELLISLLNAILKSDIVDLQIQEEKLHTEKVDDKQGYLDIKAECKNGDKIDIEVQLRDQKNMIPRTLFYWSKLYCENFAESHIYSSLRKTIVINILDFNLIKDSTYHSVYHLYEDLTHNILTDLMEIHFIEYPKFKSMDSDLNNSLHCWLLFLQGDSPESLLKEVMKMEPTIKRADEKLNFLSADQEVRRLADLRDKGIADQKAREEYVIENTQKQTARKMLDKGYPLDEISELTGLPVETLMDLLKH